MRQLAGLGWRTSTVPALCEPFRGINPLNGIHHDRGFLMPAYGGLLSAVDSAAESAIRQSLGPEVVVQPIGCAETQRRSGGLRCAVAFAG